jgi:hypothetical protein
MPVYKEGLKNVIIPTITSLLTAIKHYETQGGTASIFVNDDGMQLVNAEQAEARKCFYELNHIGWCSRPGHKTTYKDEKGKSKPLDTSDPAYFERKGQFKKASNMNYCLDFSLRVEEEYERLIGYNNDLTIEEENLIYEEARERIIERDGGRTLAAGDCRIGEIILSMLHST